ncbi:hypothetical protein N665_0307s0020 [Sinapis alba]|nr:hypothetical protein N665_0307s0020 [Sinapis alba]
MKELIAKAMERKLELENLVASLKTELKKKEKEVEDLLKVNKELKSQIMFKIENRRSRDDLSQTEIDNLNIIHKNNEPKASDVAPEGGPSFPPQWEGET